MTTQIYIDADACPVKDEVLKVAERHNIVVTLVANGGMRPSRDPMVRIVTVAKGADVADDWIADNAESGDIVITADIPLAQRCLEKSCVVFGMPREAIKLGGVDKVRSLQSIVQEIIKVN